MPYAEIIPPYIQFMKAANRSPRTIELRLYHLDTLRKRHPDLEAEQITDDMLVDMLANPDWAPNTKGAFRSSMTGFFRFAFKKGLLPDDPSKDLPSVRVPHGKPKPASDEAVNAALLKASPRVKLMITIGTRVGARAMEIAGIKTEHIEGVPGRYSLRIVGKGSKTRVVPIADDLAALLLDREPGYIFPGRIDGHIAPATVSRYVSLTLPKGVTCHKLRHRFATRAYRNSGNNLIALQQLLGHESVATTQNYAGVDDDALRATALSAE